jgi:hypothetical protein
MKARQSEKYLPVQKHGEHYVVAREWLQSDLDLLSTGDLRTLIKGPHRAVQARLYYGGSLINTTVYESTNVDDFSYALIDESPRDRTDNIATEHAKGEIDHYLHALHARCLFSEFILAEQRGYLESDFVQPNFSNQSEHSESATSVHADIKSARRLAIIGSAGAGKTTLLRRWMLDEIK